MTYPVTVTLLFENDIRFTLLEEIYKCTLASVYLL
jgi:hypothetical protein